MLLHQVNLFASFGADGYLFINMTHSLDELGLGKLAGGMRRDRLAIAPATQLALEHLGRPVPNAVLLGGLAALSGVVSLDAVVGAINPEDAGSPRAGRFRAAEHLVLRRRAEDRARPSRGRAPHLDLRRDRAGSRREPELACKSAGTAAVTGVGSKDSTACTSGRSHTGTSRCARSSAIATDPRARLSRAPR
jgi:hypothetical protein